MPLTTSQCNAFNSFLGSRPFDWQKKIAKDRKPINFLYTSMYSTENWESFTGTTHLHEKVYVTRPNDPGIWQQFVVDPCVGAPCAPTRQYIGHGVDQLRFDRYRREYQTPVFCLDQLNSVEEAIQKMNAIAEGYQELPELIASDFLRTLTLRKAGTNATQSGLFLCGVQDSQGNPIALDVSDNMFTVSQGQSLVGSNNSLLINLNANGGLTALTLGTTALFSAAIGQLSMEWLNNIQEDLAANGYHNKDWMVQGKFMITIDATSRRRLLVANPALTLMYAAADFAKGGTFYSYGVTQGCGDWLFKEDKMQMRFRFRSDLDGKDFSGNALAGAVWVEQVQVYSNVAATYGLKPVYSTDWKNAPIRLYHVYNRDARKVYVADIESVNADMKFGLARSFMGKWSWKSPDVIIATDPNTGVVCTTNNDKHNQGYWIGEYDLAEQTIYPEIERLIFALGESQPYIRIPRTNTAFTAPQAGDYQSLLAYNSLCGDAYNNPAFVLPPED